MEERSRGRRKLGWIAEKESWEQRLRQGHERYPQWGSKKLKVHLEENYGKEGMPSLSTIGRLLRTMGLSRPSRWKRRGPEVKREARAEARKSNEIWAVDFKGSFKTGDGARCDTLTITDLASRYVLCCQVMPNMGQRAVQREMRRVFVQQGLPAVIRSDNGQPFGSPGPLGLSKLSVWWLRLGLKVEHSRPGKPQDNGSHERMHRTLKADTQRPPAATLRAQQERHDQWRKYFNEERPHEALVMRKPAELYHPSARRYRSVRALCYPAGWVVRQVKGKGEISWECQRRFIGEAFAGEIVGLKMTDGKTIEVYLGKHLIGSLEAGERGGLRPAVFVRPALPPCK